MEHLAFWIPVSLAALLVYVKRDRAVADLRFIAAVLRGRRPVEWKVDAASGSMPTTSGVGDARPYPAWTASAIPSDVAMSAERHDGAVRRRSAGPEGP
ncbi:hypothetical protein [Salinarimonas sp.]|uniref:hypothetical protein n=1 Tax=Salinarimonas sp. TaxID=2766526 RepID=UPI0032D92366